MKKIFKTLGKFLGFIVINQLIIGTVALIAGIATGFTEGSGDISKHIFTITFIGHFITLILLHLMLSVYDKKLLSKEGHLHLKTNV